MTYNAKHFSITIDQPAERVYEFVSDPANLPQWAAGLSASIRKEGEDWIADSSAGRVKVRFAEKNKSGILDHTVTLPNGTDVYVPMRVIKNNEGSEVIFTLFQVKGMSDKQFSDDAELVRKDLERLKEALGRIAAGKS